jgi:hypothetical protein
MNQSINPSIYISFLSLVLFPFSHTALHFPDYLSIYSSLPFYLSLSISIYLSLST